MNAIPVTFDEHQINRTVIGGKTNDSPDALNISIILLNTSGSHFKMNVFENLLKCNFKSIISIEKEAGNTSIEDMSRKLPLVKFIVPLEKATDGEMINLAVSEIKTDYFLVLRDSLYIPSGVILSNLAERLYATDCFCIVPRLMTSNKDGLLTHFMPGAEKSHFVIDSSATVTDGIKTLYPFDFIGLYNRKKFIQVGGFDYTIVSPYWQNLDFAMRAWLFGEEIRHTTLLQFSYVDEVPVEDRTVNKDYLRYYLKNEIVKFKNEKAYISRGSFFKFFFHSSSGYLDARRQFVAARDWVEKSKYRFRMDLQTLVQSWSSGK
ncbi:MAG: hypothetical protein MJ162_02945 [Treponema sp.]|nr:hypothetical protein [Treponema sp.]